MAYSAEPFKFPKKRFFPNRFDDPLGRYRTLYCAAERLTCFYEVLAHQRPDPAATARTTAIQLTLPGVEGAEGLGNTVTRAWRRRHVLISARVELIRGGIIDLRRMHVRQQIARESPDFLAEHGIQDLDLDRIQDRTRHLARHLSRLLYEGGAAGAIYPSRLEGVCLALFERRARLVPAGRPERLTNPPPELRQACHHLGLSLGS